MAVKSSYIMSGLSCPHCALKVERFLSLNKGILKVKLDFPSSKLTITYKREEFSKGQLEELVASIGFEVKID